MYMQEKKLEYQVKTMIHLRSQLDVQVKRNVKAAQSKQKKHYDRRHQEGSFEVGQKVLVKNMKRLSKKGDKMAPNWFGPYEVAEYIGTNTYYLKKMGGKKRLKVAYSSTRLKLFNERGKECFGVLARPVAINFTRWQRIIDVYKRGYFFIRCNPRTCST